jgi:hypothetical protein
LRAGPEAGPATVARQMRIEGGAFEAARNTPNILYSLLVPFCD